MRNRRIQLLMERAFTASILFVIVITLLVGVCFSRYDAVEKQKENIRKIHAVLSQLIFPSLLISDISEIRHLLYMTSSKNETFLVLDKNHTVIMSDYLMSSFSDWAKAYEVKRCLQSGFGQEEINGVNYIINCSVLSGFDSYNNKNTQGVLLSFTKIELSPVSMMVLTLLLVLFFSYVVVILFFRRFLDTKLVNPLIDLKDKVSLISFNGNQLMNEMKNSENAPLEVLEIEKAFTELLQQLNNEYQNSIEAKKKHALFELSMGVAHDIRSPVVALEMIIKDIGNIDEDKRLIMRNAASRIKDIANNLLTQYRLGKSSDEIVLQVALEPELVIEHISRILSEKRTQYKGDKVVFEFNFDESVCGKFALLNLANFSRVLSNIIDNAIEAGSSAININIRNLLQEKEYIDVEIVDNGKGIPVEILKKINDGQQVTGKANGHGLGLLQAKKAIEIDWRGRLVIESEQGKGSIMHIMLPSTPNPDWFSSRINIIPNMKIVVLDDDESIHHVWKERLKALNKTGDIIDFYHPAEFLAWVLKNKENNILFLIDYEYIGNTLSGLDVIQQADIANSACLVTSRYEEDGVRNRAAALGVKIIPKSYAVHIPIHNNEITPDVDLVLLDNDIMITAAWRLRALISNKKIAVFNCWGDLLRAVSFYDKKIPFYVDYELQDGLKGEVCAQKLYELGYHEIYLTTGHPPEYFSEMPWIKKILGKETPF